MPDHSLRRDTLVIRAGESLPTASVEFFLCRAVVQAAASDDVEYVCLLTAAGTYAWVDTTASAPVGAKYIVQTADATLTNEQALGALATGLLKNTTTTGVLSIAVAGTDYPITDAGYFSPPGPVAIDAATVTALVAQETLARYVGYATKDLTGTRMHLIVTTAANTITWAEVALASAQSTGSLNLTLLGSAVDVSATFNSTGVKQVSINTAIPAGTHVYLLAGSDATTPFQVRATPGNEFSSTVPYVAHKTATRPSTMAANTAFSASTSANYAASVAARWF